jgi:hypothetical protein
LLPQPSAELGASDDALTQMLWRQARAKVLARRGNIAEAERLAREAIAIGAATEMPDTQADAQSDLAEVLTRTGRTKPRARSGRRSPSTSARATSAWSSARAPGSAS